MKLEPDAADLRRVLRPANCRMLDDRDRKLLTLIQRDAEASVTELAECVALSVSACARLREAGYIARQVAILDRRAMRVPTTVFAMLRTTRHGADWLDAFRRAVADIPEIIEVHRLTGHYDCVLKIVLPNVERDDKVYKDLVGRVELFDVSASISMETLKDDTALPTGFARGSTDEVADLDEVLVVVAHIGGQQLPGRAGARRRLLDHGHVAAREVHKHLRDWHGGEEAQVCRAGHRVLRLGLDVWSFWCRLVSMRRSAARGGPRTPRAPCQARPRRTRRRARCPRP